MSLDDAYLPAFNEPLGIEVATNIKRRNNLVFNAKIVNDNLKFTARSERKITIDPKQTTVLAKEQDGNPILLKTSPVRVLFTCLPFRWNIT